MPIRYAEGAAPRAIFEGRCLPEEADGLLEWLRGTTDPVVELGVCTALHTALAQLLLASRARLAVLPPDPLLAACLVAEAPSGHPRPAADPEFRLPLVEGPCRPASSALAEVVNQVTP